MKYFQSRRRFIQNISLFSSSMILVGLFSTLQPSLAKKKRVWKPYPQERKVTYIAPLSIDISARGIIRKFPSYSSRVKEGRLRTEIIEVQDNYFILERRMSVNSAGGRVTRSYAQHRVEYAEEVTQNERIITFIPISTYGRQRSLIGKWDIHTYSLEQITNYLESALGSTRRTFEVNSNYPSEAITANFDRILANQRSDGPVKDNNTGKQFTRRYFLNYNNKKAYFLVETYPYRNGSKAVIYIDVPVPSATTDHVIDLRRLDEIEEKLKVRITKIVNN